MSNQITEHTIESRYVIKVQNGRLDLGAISLVPRHQIFCVRPAALLFFVFRFMEAARKTGKAWDTYHMNDAWWT